MIINFGHFKMSKDIQDDISGIDDVQVLKDMLISQRKELNQKDQEVKTLEETISDLISEIKNYKNLEQELMDTSVLQNAHEAIDNLMGEKSELEDLIIILKKTITDLEERNEVLLQNNENLKVKQSSVVELESKIFQLNKKISELEQENIKLNESGGNMTSEKEYTSNLENKIVEYDEKITSLEKVNKLHRETIDKLRADQSSMVATLENKIKEQNDYVASLVKENREIRKEIEATKPEQPSVNIEGNIIRLQKEVANLKKENEDLTEKNQLLKAALLLHVDLETAEVTDTTIKPIPAQIPKEPEIVSERQIPMGISRESDIDKSVQITEIPTGKVREIVSQRHAVMEESEIVDIRETEQVADVPKGIVQQFVNKRHEAMETREIPEEPPETTEEPPKTVIEPPSEQIIKEPEISTTTQEKVTVKSPPQAAEIPDLDNIGVIETSDGRRKCPICGNENLRQIREVEDKTKIISAYPRMYGKKFKCGQCGAEWR